MAAEKEYTVPASAEDSRLDAFVAGAANCGTRAAKRLIEGGAVLVDGKARPALFKLRQGMTVLVTPVGIPPHAEEPDAAIVAVNREYAVISKPAGLHTARIAGSREASLEGLLGALWETMLTARQKAPLPKPNLPPSLADALGGACPDLVPDHDPDSIGDFPLLPATPPTLLSRLDKPTSGLVAAAVTTQAAERFRTREAMGQVRKYYLAVVRGNMTAPMLIKGRLDTDGRKKTRVLSLESSDPARHTNVTPIGPAMTFVPGAPDETTLVVARIGRGARHQIRAHLADSGHPLAGDALYGDSNSARVFYLHHARLCLPGLTALCLPPWLHLP